ncbi:hypothetical protein JAO29_14750 [Edaphobacter sp. HDX4]|uniref:hypothetical protein n=1 Tax=Edaphobacter sp. HDX4 TaxID=2794064 RepID=UPI002FE5D04A
MLPIETLQKLAEYPELKNEDFTVRQTYLREHLADANIQVLHALKESELKANGLAFKERSAFEKRTRDPDDCYLEVVKREEERRKQGLPSLIGIQRGMRRATSDEILADIYTDLDRNSSGVDKEDERIYTDDNGHPESTEIYIVPEDGDDDLRQRIINRVESLRTALTMTKDEFRALIGPPASSNWMSFVEADASEAWNHVTPQMFEKIAKALGIGSGELLQ